MRLVTVAMGGLCVTADPDVVLITHALGSCVAVTAHDPLRKLGGMLHFMLPDKASARTDVDTNRAMFADVGIPLLIEELVRRGAIASALVVKLCGGAKIRDEQNVFDVGRRNHTAARRALWRAGVPVAAEDVGGNEPRTASLVVATGDLRVRSLARETVI